MYNKIILIGRLTKDPEGRMTTSGINVTRFSIAVDRTFAKQGQEKITDFFQVVTWRRLAEITAQYLKKGKLIAVEGRVQVNKYTKDGEDKEMVEIVGDNVQMLDRGNPESAIESLEAENVKN